MNATAISGIVMSSLNVIETILPLLGPGGAAVGAIAPIIGALVKIEPVIAQIAPLVPDEATLIFQGVKNIIGNLRGGGVATSADEDAALDALDARVDSGWDKISAQFDPDAGTAA